MSEGKTIRVSRRQAWGAFGSGRGCNCWRAPSVGSPQFASAAHTAALSQQPPCMRAWSDRCRHPGGAGGTRCARRREPGCRFGLAGRLPAPAPGRARTQGAALLLGRGARGARHLPQGPLPVVAGVRGEAMGGMDRDAQGQTPLRGCCALGRSCCAIDLLLGGLPHIRRLVSSLHLGHHPVIPQAALAQGLRNAQVAGVSACVLWMSRCGGRTHWLGQNAPPSPRAFGQGG
mmetsp:Transcript_43778/g.121654  ORF Transcript_43778/g.121654 Transcript_43778/m.121654 type:complete len:231 (+) Transcript_43778:202-894(+)